MKLPFEPGAAEEFEAAATWYERERTDYGELFMSAVRGSVNRAARFPQSGIQVHGFGRERDVRRFTVVPPQNLVQRAIVDVSALGVKLADAPILHLLCALLATTSDRQHKRECHCVHGPSRNCQ